MHNIQSKYNDLQIIWDVYAGSSEAAQNENELQVTNMIESKKKRLEIFEKKIAR